VDEWISQSPDGREVVVRRKGEFWTVRCGSSLTESRNLDVALARALRADLDFVAHRREFDYPSWIRTMANTIDPER
jgi:hypothetical protein